MWIHFYSATALLGIFLTITSWLNGRSTKRLIKQIHQDTQNLISSEVGKMADLIASESQNTRKLIKSLHTTD